MKRMRAVQCGWPLTPNLQAAWIYGSVAKKTDTAQSDIDVMLVGSDLLLGDVHDSNDAVQRQCGNF